MVKTMMMMMMMMMMMIDDDDDAVDVNIGPFIITLQCFIAV